MSPLPLDERRIGRLADICDAIEAEAPRGSDWKIRHAAAHAALARACETAAINARAIAA